MGDAFPEIQHRITLEEGNQQYDAMIPAAIQTVAGRGIPVQREPPTIQTPQGPTYFTGQLPHDLTKCTDDQLGDLLTSIARWQEFVETDLAAAHMNFKKAQARMEHVEALLRVAYRNDELGKKRTEQERKDVIKSDRRYVEAQSQLLYYETIYRLTNAVAESANRNWETVSRRITQRQQEIERGKREWNVGQTSSPVFRHTPR